MNALGVFFKRCTGLGHARSAERKAGDPGRFSAPRGHGASASWHLLLACVACLVATGASQACPTSGDETGRVAAVEPRLELRLADGRLLRLVGLDPPLETPTDPDLGENARTRLSTMLAGQEITFQMVGRAPDRWGRLPALAFVTNQDGAAGSIVTLAIGAGLGRYLPEAAARGCRDDLAAAEANARLAKLGLWDDPYYAVLAVDDHAGFMERAGTNVLAEGRLTAVQPSPYRTTLRFAASTHDVGTRDPAGQTRPGQGSFGGHMLVATIMPHAMKSFEAKQVNLRALIGRRLRFRGLLDLRFGPRIELASPDQIEPLDAASRQSPN